MIGFYSKLLSKFQNSYWLSSAFFTFSSKVSSTLFGFVNFFLLIRLLSKDDYGAWVLFFSVTNLMELIKHGFVRNPLLRYLSVAIPEDSSRIQTASLFLNTVIGLIQVVLLVIFSEILSVFWNSPQLKSLFLIYSLTTVALIPINHFDIVQHAKMNFRGTFFSNLTRQGGLFVYVLVIALWGFSVTLTQLAVVQFISVLLSGLISFFFAKEFLQLSKKVDYSWVSTLFHYGKYTFGTNVSSMIVKNVDSWMLGKMISPAAVAIMNPAIRLSNLVEVPTDTLTAILFPKLSVRVEAEGLGSVKYLYEKAVGTILAIMIPSVAFVIIFAEPIVLLIAGAGFEETVPILQITMLYGLFIPFNRFLGITLDAIGKARSNFLIVIQMAIMNVVSNYFFIKQFGIIGAAYGTLFTYTLALIYVQVYLYREIGVRFSGVVSSFIKSYSYFYFLGKRLLLRLR